MAPVTDFHVHLVRYEQLQPWVEAWIGRSFDDYKAFVDRLSQPAAMVEYLRANGVDYAVILPEMSPITTGISTNEQVVDFCRGYPMMIPFATVNPYLVNSPAGELRRCVKELGVRGVKLYPTYNYFYPNDRMMYPLYETAQELGIPVMLHTGSSIFKGARLKYGDPLYLDDVAVDFPELKILLVHSGRGFWYDRAFFLSRLHENVYMEIAGLPPQNLLHYFPELERNADKIIFGSDFPGMPFIKQNIEAIRQMAISEEAKEKILGGNAARLLGI